MTDLLFHGAWAARHPVDLTLGLSDEPTAPPPQLVQIRLALSPPRVRCVVQYEARVSRKQVIRELRDLLWAWRDARRMAWQTTVKVITTGILAALLVGAAIKLKLMGGAQ